MKLEEIKPIFIVKLPPMGSTEDEKLSIGNYDEANLYYGNLACTEIKGFSENQMQEYAKECVREALKILDNAILPIFEDDERVVIQKIFEEDTKNESR